MTTRFWDEPAGDDKALYDPLYILNRDSECRDDVREFVEQLWLRHEPYCGDANFLDEARRQFQQFTWQMYIGACLLEAGLSQKVKVLPTSARWAWVEYMIAQSESIAGLAIMDAHHAGGSFAAYKRAFAERGVVPTGPRARVPSSLELISLKKKRLASFA